MINPFNPPPSAAPAPAAWNPDALDVPTFPKIRAWSYSVVQQHKRCAQALRFRKIDRLPEPEGEPILRGKSVHDQLAHLIHTGEWPAGCIVPHAEVWRKRLLHLHVANAQAELQLAFDKDWTLIEWFGAGVWARVVVDAVHFHGSGTFAVVHEHKTGKYYPEHVQQERLYALAIFKAFPNVMHVAVQCNYIDMPERAVTIVNFIREIHETQLENEFNNFPEALLQETLYPASPGTHCKWCHFRKSNAGPCTFG